MMEDKDVFSHVALGFDDVALLKKIIVALPILADVSRADLLLYCRASSTRAIVVAQAMPHSVSPLYASGRVGLQVSPSEQPEVWQALNGRLNPRWIHTVDVRGATVARQVFPVRNAQGVLIAVLVMDSYWLAHERQLRRSKVFQKALQQFRDMVLRGELVGAESLTPFGEHDGIVYVGADRRIQYMSGVAAGLYRLLGYRDNLIGRRVNDLDTVDPQMVSQIISERRCLERQDEQHGLAWIRRALPICVPDQSWRNRLGAWMRPEKARGSHLQGAFILIHDATEALQAKRELESKMALIREVHHRVKNNLQVIASIMRMQARRVSGQEAKTALQESVSRILSVAVVHEFLSQNAQGNINLEEVARRILGQVQQGLLDPDKRIRLSVKGVAIWLPAERATQCALVINELVQNAIEHGMAQRSEGNIEVVLDDHGEKVSITVKDDGEGLPSGFDLSKDAHLGLSIVRSMVERDLKGAFELFNDHGTCAVARFDKSMLGGN